MQIQLWSYNYDPEPTGIAPLSAVFARELSARGHAVEVVAAHPHYPEPRWGHSRLPYREQRDGIEVLRLPLWVGRETAAQRIRQELTFASSLAAALPTLSRPDVIVAVSPSFPGLAPAMFNARARRVPWVLWLQDILPDGAAATGILDEGPLIRAARRFERRAYRSASRIVVISGSFAENLRAKGVPEHKLTQIFNPVSRSLRDAPRPPEAIDPATVLTLGNIGHTQNLVAITRAFEASDELRELGARFVMVGDGVAGDDVRAAIETDRVEVTGVIYDEEALERQLERATIALVSQSYEGYDFNVPSKLMNFMGRAIPVAASVRSDSEVARIVERSGGGWVSNSPEDCMRTIAAALRDSGDRERRSEAALRFASEHFAAERFADRFEELLRSLVAGQRP